VRLLRALEACEGAHRIDWAGARLRFVLVY